MSHPLNRRLKALETASETEDPDLLSARGQALASPEALACTLTTGLRNPYYAQLPHLRLIDQAFLKAVEGTGDKIGIFMPPRAGKSLRLRWCLLWFLATRPDDRIIVATASQPLAEAHGRWIRNMIREHGPFLGIELDPGSQAANRLDIKGREGGLFATSVGGAGVGMGCSVLLCDDPVRSRKDASSRTVMGATEEWWRDVATTRLTPEGSIVLCHTRWDEQDLAGRLLAAESDSWTVVDIPAVAMTQEEYEQLGIPPAVDPLGRQPGESFDPVRWPLEVLAKRRRDVGESGWWSLYQQQPRRPEGALLKPQEITDATVREVPQGRCVVAVDPAGEGDDEVGVIVAVQGPDGCVYLVQDVSGSMNSAQWPEVVCRASLDHGAGTVVVEGNGVGQAGPRLIRLAWAEGQREGWIPEERLVPNILLKTASQSKWARAEPVAALIRNGSVKFGPGLGRCAHEFLTWSPDSSYSPGRLDAAVWAVTELNPLKGRSGIGNPARPPATSELAVPAVPRLSAWTRSIIR